MTEDKGAALLALGELGRSRVASSFDLWDDLRTRGVVDQARFDRLCNQTRIKGNTSLPGVPWRLRST